MNSATSSRACPPSAGAPPARPPRRGPGLTCGRSPTSWGSRWCDGWSWAASTSTSSCASTPPGSWPRTPGGSVGHSRTTPPTTSAGCGRVGRAYLGPGGPGARDGPRGELPAPRAAAEGAAIHWEDDAAREAFAALSVFFFVHGEYEGGETLERIVAALRQGGNTGGKLRSALAYRVRSAAWLGYDERYQPNAREVL